MGGAYLRVLKPVACPEYVNLQGAQNKGKHMLPSKLVQDLMVHSVLYAFRSVCVSVCDE